MHLCTYLYHFVYHIFVYVRRDPFLLPGINKNIYLKVNEEDHGQYGNTGCGVFKRGVQN